MVGFLRFMKRKRWLKSKHPDDNNMWKHRSDTGSTSIDDTEYDEAPWRAASVLSSSPIGEKDWWTTSHHSSNSDSHNDNNKAEMDASTKKSPSEQQQQQQQPPEEGATNASLSDGVIAPSSGAATTTDIDTAQFHNRGYEVWEQCRDAWRCQGGGRTTSSPAEEEGQEVYIRHSNNNNNNTSSSSSPRPLSNNQRRNVVQGLTKQRQYTLPRRIRLDELIDVYQEIWNEDGSD